MKIYNYNDNGIYVGASDAIKCPKTNEHLIPRNATKTKPMNVSDGCVARFVNGEWSEETYYNNAKLYDSNNDYAEVTVNGLNTRGDLVSEIPADILAEREAEEQANILSKCKAIKQSEIDTISSDLQSGYFYFSFGGTVYKTKIKDELQGQNLASSAFFIACLTETSSGNLVAKIPYTDAKEELNTMTSADKKSWAMGLQAYLSGIYEKRLNNQTALELLTDEEALALQVKDMDWVVEGISEDNPYITGE